MKPRLYLLTIFLLLPFSGIAIAEAEREVVIQVNGMFCPFCTFGVEKRLKKLEEVDTVWVDLASGEAIAKLKPEGEFIERHFTDAIDRAGFTHSGIHLRDATGTNKNAESKFYPLPENKEIRSKGGSGYVFRTSIGGKGKDIGQFIQPTSIAFASDGSFIVNDSGNSRIQKFYPDGRPGKEWKLSGDGKTSLGNPVGLAVGNDGDIWVTDYDLDTVNHYNSEGIPQGIFGSSGSKSGEFDAPSGVAITRDGLIAVSDFYHHRIQIFTRDGLYLRSIGAKGLFRRIRASGLNYPTRIAVSLDGILWVSDAYNHRVVAFDSQGKVVHQIGENGHDYGQFEVSSGIAFIPSTSPHEKSDITGKSELSLSKREKEIPTTWADNQLAVADFMNHRIQIWTTEGEFIGDLGSQGSEFGQFERPTDVALSPKGELYVVDWGNNRIQVFSTH